MKRREFIELLGAMAATGPLAVRAQSGERMRRIGVLMDLAENDPEGQARIIAFKRGLVTLGWAEGRNIRIDYRWAAGTAANMRTFAAELVGMKPDVILDSGTPPLVALQLETHTIPIVFAQVIDPVAGGFVENLARPGGNITGFTSFEYAMSGKWLETLKEIAPRVTRVAIVLEKTKTPGIVGMLGAIQGIAPSFAVEFSTVAGHDAAEFEHAIDGFAREPGGGLIVLPSPNAILQRDLIVGLAAQRRLPAIYPYRFFVTAGGLISYGVNPAENFRRAAAYVDAILKGSKPADLPVQQPTKFDLTINLTAAKALGLTVPPTLLARADEVVD